MTQRFDICEGDTTTAGGTVYATSQANQLHGRAVVYEGDPIWCPTCKTEGSVLCVGERLPNQGVDGRQQALGYDWCMCKCDPKPFLIASQNQSGMCA
ncbi:PAAR domain-containing protein [Paraburkholderia caffeinilytica]|uniref:PAAR domain-containing protein n=1 Tax=Paraburkholderia caffeinilytica TaxID=1761016 RepID=A0ABQ1N0G7_9BURK|nr:PAAR domain-containing protein [Paraburkholderia caffeinilytica]GGC50406.1 hypothetical protein GCM10011400_42270 [Paraburkholderia caffeinilytica]CAB3788556.1 hypothetical protein LMG28690_02681 [Paraburkholderia caffeinilytica]